MATLRVGDRAPSFSLKDKTGKTRSLRNIKSKYTVVYFYPKDDTSGCTLEAKGFTRNLARLRKLGAQVVGISGGNTKSKQHFCKKHRIKVTLLSDPSFKTAKNFKSFGAKKFMGKTYKGIARNTFILDKEKRIIKMFNSVNPTTHPEEVIRFLKKGGSKAATKTRATIRKAIRRARTNSRRTNSRRKVRATARRSTSKRSPARSSLRARTARRRQARRRR